MKAIELFSGNGDLTNMFKSKGIDCISVDYDPNKSPDLCADVYGLSDEYLKQFDFIWLSPDCTTYSIAQHGIHRKKGGVPVSEYAVKCDYLNSQFFKRLIKLDIPFIAENPRGYMSHAPFVFGLYRKTIYYSTFGGPAQKPTDLFSNRYWLLFEICDTITPGEIKFDQLKGHDRFLTRCKMPPLLLEIITDNVIRYFKEN